MAPKKWEYKELKKIDYKDSSTSIAGSSSPSYKPIEDILYSRVRIKLEDINELGKEGWEVINSTADENGLTYVLLKREVIDKRKPTSRFKDLDDV